MNDFDSISFFRRLTESNRLARSHGFRFKVVSDLEGFSEALESMQDYIPLVCVSDTSSGTLSLDVTPSERRVKTVFMFMPHSLQNDPAFHRQRCFDIMRAIFRQFMSVLLRERTKLRLDGVYLDRHISFEEIDRYFFSGGACAYFNIALDKYVNLSLQPDQWITDPTPPRLSNLDVNMPSASVKP